jgi:hypothetical protein
MAEAKAPGGLAERIKRARAFSATLNTTTDSLNAALLEAQESIASLNLGVTASVQFPSSEDADFARYLSFERWGGDWCLTVETHHDYTDEVKTVLLLETSRETRLAAADLLPDLVDRLMDQAEKLIDTVGAKVVAVQEFAKRLREAQS